MKQPDLPENESERLDTLYSLNLLDSEQEVRFDTITRLAKNVFQVPIAIVSLVDKNRQWFKSCFGLEANETERNISFCGHNFI